MENSRTIQVVQLIRLFRHALTVQKSREILDELWRIKVGWDYM